MSIEYVLALKSPESSVEGGEKLVCKRWRLNSSAGLQVPVLWKQQRGIFQ